jgi:hypothetical protein
MPKALHNEAQGREAHAGTRFHVVFIPDSATLVPFAGIQARSASECV